MDLCQIHSEDVFDSLTRMSLKLRSRSSGTKRITAESSPLTMHSKACNCTPYTASSSRQCYSVTTGGDRVTAVHASGGLRTVYVW